MIVTKIGKYICKIITWPNVSPFLVFYSYGKMIRKKTVAFQILHPELIKHAENSKLPHNQTTLRAGGFENATSPKIKLPSRKSNYIYKSSKHFFKARARNYRPRVGGPVVLLYSVRCECTLSLYRVGKRFPWSVHPPFT